LGTKYGFGEILDLYWHSRIGYWKRHDKAGTIVAPYLFGTVFGRVQRSTAGSSGTRSEPK